MKNNTIYFSYLLSTIFFIILLAYRDTLSMATTSEKRIMLSYNWKSQQVVSKVYDILRAANISVWMDIKGGMKDDIYKRYVQL